MVVDELVLSPEGAIAMGMSGVVVTVPMTTSSAADNADADADAVAVARTSGVAEMVPMTISPAADDVLAGDKSGTLGMAFSDTGRSISVLIAISAGLSSSSSADDESEVVIL
jgi:hypothetical protein